MRKRIGLLILLIGWNTMAFNAVGVKNIDLDTPTQKHFLDLSNEEIEDKYGLDLSWKEKIGLWLMRKKIKQQLKKEKKLEQLKAECREPSECYKVLLRSGKVVYARDFRIEEDKLRYQWCNHAHQQSKIAIDKVIQVYDPNGKVVFTNEGYTTFTNKKIEPMGVVSFFSFLLGILIILLSIPIAFGLLLLVLGLFGISLLFLLISLVKFASFPGKYKGITYPILTIILWGIGILLLRILFSPA